MLTMMFENWWVILLRGILAIILGALLILFPGITIQSLVLVFGAYALIDGIGTLWTAIRYRGQPRWWVHLLQGILGIIAGILVFLYPAFATISAVFFVLYIIAFWAIFTGVMEIIAAIQLRKEIEGEFWMALGGVLSILFGALLIFFPGAGILTLVTVMAAYEIVFGITLILLAFRVRNAQGQAGSTTQTRQPV
jgi:uncharacterized membrane protein HdeD (DUF308 family)